MTFINKLIIIMLKYFRVQTCLNIIGSSVLNSTLFTITNTRYNKTNRLIDILRNNRYIIILSTQRSSPTAESCSFINIGILTVTSLAFIDCLTTDLIMIFNVCTFGLNIVDVVIDFVINHRARDNRLKMITLCFLSSLKDWSITRNSAIVDLFYFSLIILNTAALVIKSF